MEIEKQEQIRKLALIMIQLALKAVKVALLKPSKSKVINKKRMTKILILSMQARKIQIQINIIKSQPISIKALGNITKFNIKGKEMILTNE